MDEEQRLQEGTADEASECEFDRTDEEILVQEWRTKQLQRLGLSRVLAEGFAKRVDWHDVAALVARGCSAELALLIVY
jgi:hypothetical protein